MSKKNVANDSTLKPFFEELNKYADGVHTLNEGISNDEIERLEKHLNIKLPLVYKKFLQICNGGELFAVPVGTVISEVHVPSKGPMQIGGAYLNEAFKVERRWPGMPQDYLIIADTSYGDTICMDLSTNDGNEAEIVKWSHEDGDISNRWRRLIDWLMEELEIGAMLVSYDGSDKD
ncbi:MAG: hypothetical protein H6Q69_4434 [Firmicutes bacterium]|nr:hypothetical protein [Bacillota bacterium]